MDESETPPEIKLDEHDTAAVIAILMRAIRAGDQIKEDREIVEEANARLAENNVILSKATNALALFGFEKREGQNIWDHVWDVIGKAAYQRAMAIARGAEPASLLEQMGGDPNAEAGQGLAATSVHRPIPVRDAILRHLRAVGDKGTNVGEIKRHLAEAYGITVHQKTPGMTLYRLLKDGLASREGRTWYATEERKENSDEENAGADLL